MKIRNFCNPNGYSLTVVEYSSQLTKPLLNYLRSATRISCSTIPLYLYKLKQEIQVACLIRLSEGFMLVLNLPRVSFIWVGTGIEKTLKLCNYCGLKCWIQLHLHVFQKVFPLLLIRKDGYFRYAHCCCKFLGLCGSD